jgi:hypothetical protein
VAAGGEAREQRLVRFNILSSTTCHAGHAICTALAHGVNRVALASDSKGFAMTI